MKNDAKLPCCPFYFKEKEGKLYCEGAVIKFPDRVARGETVDKYCSSMENYYNCTICKMLMSYYERSNR